VKPTLEIDGRAITLLGSFNPLIFQPAWFVQQELLSTDEAEGEALSVDVITKDIVAFHADWLQIQVIDGRFLALATHAGHFDELRDLVANTFSILHHTPIHAVGLNRDSHFQMGSESDWHAVGHRLVPPDNFDSVLKQPGLASLVVQGVRDDGRDGARRVKIEPSARLEHGVFIEANDEIRFRPPDSSRSAREVVELLSGSVWDDFETYAARVIDEVFNQL
jgi:hypothetical protein